MSARNGVAWVVVCTILFAMVLLTGCASVERAWYRCDPELWTGWDYQKECQRIAKAEAARGSHNK